MLKTLASAMAGAMLAAVILTAHGAYDQLAHQARINNTPSAEVLKFHASVQASINISLKGRAGLPDLGGPSYGPKIITIDPDGRVRSVG